MPPPTANPDRWLLVTAAPAEARAILAALNADPALAAQEWHPHPLTPTFDMIVSGIGKANAAAATALSLDRARHAAILSVGIAGALPGTDLPIGQRIAATASIYADEGLQTPDLFMDCSQMGFPLCPGHGSRLDSDPQVLNTLLQLPGTVSGAIATVSTCSGTHALAAQVALRTGAIAECMEGAAVAHIARRLGVPHGEFRVISNTTGDRPLQKWDLKIALAELQAAVGELAAARAASTVR